MRSIKKSKSKGGRRVSGLDGRMWMQERGKIVPLTREEWDILKGPGAGLNMKDDEGDADLGEHADGLTWPTGPGANYERGTWRLWDDVYAQRKDESCGHWRDASSPSREPGCRHLAKRLKAVNTATGLSKLYGGGSGYVEATAWVKTHVDTFMPLCGDAWEQAPLWWKGEIIGRPMEDFGVWPIEVLVGFAQEIATRIEAGRSVLVMCTGGHGRTGTVLAAAASALGWVKRDPVTWIRENYCKHAIETPGQETAVREAHALLRK